MISGYVLWNVFVFLLYGFDKLAAKRNMWRISEKKLLSAAVLAGGIGAFLGMEVFRHKTKNRTFKNIVPLLCAVNLAVIIFLSGFHPDIF